MNFSSISPNIEAADTNDGVFYRLHFTKDDRLPVSTGPLVTMLVLLIAVPATAAGLAIFFLGRHFHQISATLLMLSGLFVVQMFLLARLPWRLLKQQLWQKLAASSGHGEVELRGDQLFLGSRVGFYWAGERRNVREFERLVVHVPVSSDVVGTLPASTESASETKRRAERAVLAVEISEKRPWLLVDGFSRTETMALADHLYRRLTVVTERRLPPPQVRETPESALYPPLRSDFYRGKRPWWLALQLSGMLGLGGLTAVAVETGAWQSRHIRGALIVAWFLELLLLAFTIRFTGPNDDTKNPMTPGL
jgi:hypothetical protein